LLNLANSRNVRQNILIKYSTSQPLEGHKICKANNCIKNHTATYVKWKGNSGDIVTFWLPIDAYPDYFIHFSVGVAIKY
jgi:hypothetical protein